MPPSAGRGGWAAGGRKGKGKGNDEDTDGQAIDKWAVAVKPFDDEVSSFDRWPAYKVRHVPCLRTSPACLSENDILLVGCRREIVSGWSERREIHFFVSHRKKET